MTPLHSIGEWLRTLLLEVPLPAVRALFLLTLIGLAAWVVRLPKTATCPPEGAKRWDENLKIGALLALAIQIVIYALL